MSFLTRTSTTLLRSARLSTPRASAAFSTSIIHQKSAVDATKDVLKKVDRTVGDAAVKGIETGESASAKVKETVGIKSGEAKGKAHELSGEAKGKAKELKGEAKAKLS